MNKSELRLEAEAELKSILSYWINYTVDKENGGFYGKIDNNNKTDAHAPKGAVLNSRILWSFSAAYEATNESSYLLMADRAYHYFTGHFIDRTYGGVYWSVDYKGKPLEKKKQIYAQAFAVYALSAYYKITMQQTALQEAIQIYRSTKQHSQDRECGGYIEALSESWTDLADIRLSDKDANERKSMNTHLHLLEGFTNLYSVWPDVELKGDIMKLIHLFTTHIINPTTMHLNLFFDDAWNVKSEVVSYGHDIEAAWLIQEAASLMNDKALLQHVKEISVQMAEAVLEGVDVDGGLWYEKESSAGALNTEKHWWPQAEAVVGFLNAWQLTDNEKYFKQSVDCWKFIQQKIKHPAGEWAWGITANGQLMNEDKAGFWKCPYHNSRACLEIMKRIN